MPYFIYVFDELGKKGIGKGYGGIFWRWFVMSITTPYIKDLARVSYAVSMQWILMKWIEILAACALSG